MKLLLVLLALFVGCLFAAWATQDTSKLDVQSKPSAAPTASSLDRMPSRTQVHRSSRTRHHEPPSRLDLLDWPALRMCESSDNPHAVSPGGRYRGLYQFDQETWESVGGTGDPAHASREEQDYRALVLFMRRGAQPWPRCGKRL